MTDTAYDAVVALRRKYDGQSVVPIEALDNIIDKHKPDIAAAIANITGAPIHLPVSDRVVTLIRLPASIDSIVAHTKAATREHGKGLVVDLSTHIDGWYVLAHPTPKDPE